MLKIEAPSTASRERLSASTLPHNCAEDELATQAIGERWLVSARTVLLEVPSVLVPKTWNSLINPLHPEAGTLRIAEVYQHPFDTRLLR